MNRRLQLGSAVLSLFVLACAREEPAPIAPVPVDAPAPIACTDAATSPLATLDARVIDALRGHDDAALRALASPELDVAAAMGVGEIPESHPYIACAPLPTGIETRYVGPNSGMHELRLAWRLEDGRWSLTSVSSYGW